MLQLLPDAHVLRNQPVPRQMDNMLHQAWARYCMCVHSTLEKITVNRARMPATYLLC